MSEAVPPGSTSVAPIDPGDLGACINALRTRGAHRADPVRFRFIESLGRRAAACDGELRRLLDAKLAKALADYGARTERAEGGAEHHLGRGRDDAPHALDGLQRGVTTNAPCQGHRGPLGDLVDHIARRSSEKRPAGSPGGGTASGSVVVDVATLQYFRRTWSRLSVDHQLSQSLAKVPENAGPLNSHRLVSRSLEWMRHLSPAYLHRFMSHVDALLWLDQAIGSDAAAPATTTPRGDGAKKRKSTGRKAT